MKRCPAVLLDAAKASLPYSFLHLGWLQVTLFCHLVAELESHLRIQGLFSGSAIAVYIIYVSLHQWNIQSEHG